ncbi:S-layer homology domain-containing protein [Paenibacillus guangzhouensis]|uniref:S-layer homology domain-containing protein n=1 Tax=Paenibacillus guangzhouensis TaxID=1473112 RepID=UPI001266EB83|nr:S-layer homology domain-containing protein [Paenibacillus guangzhouensis]
MSNRTPRCIKMISFIAVCLLYFVWNPPAAFAESVDSLLPERSEQEIKDKWSQWMNPSSKGQTVFDETPLTSSPYRAGKLNEAYVQQGLDATNFYRFISGLPGDLRLDPSLNEQAQYGAVLVSTLGRLSHYPSQPSDMDKAFYDKGYRSTTSSNLYYTTRSLDSNLLVDSVRAYMDDSDDKNIDNVGHRRWILNPQLQQIGFGLAAHQDKSYSSMQVQDKSRTNTIDYNYSLFPNQGAFPLEAFKSDYAWSVQLNPKRFQEPALDDVRVELIRLGDQRRWTFDQSTQDKDIEQLHFNISTINYGNNYAITFRPDDVQLLKNGDVFKVNITGLKKTDGTPADISYQTRFFSIDSRTEDRVSGLSIEPREITVQAGDEIAMPAVRAYTENGEQFSMKSGFSYTSSSQLIDVRNGKIKGLQPGIAKITIRYEGKTAELKVNVKPSTSLTDIGNHWAREAIQWGVQRQMASGYADGTFRPNNEVTEAEFLAMLFKLYADTKILQQLDQEHPIKIEVWSDKYYRYARSYNVDLEAIKNKKLRDRPITRQEVAYIVASLNGRNYADRQDAIRYLLNMGFSTGKTAPTVEGFAGQEKLTRAEAVAFLKNLYEHGFELHGRPEAFTIFTDNEKNGGFPDYTVRASFTSDHQLILKGTFSKIANRTVTVFVNGPAPKQKQLLTQTVTGDAGGNFTLTADNLDADKLIINIETEPNYLYQISVDLGRVKMNEYRK